MTSGEIRDNDLRRTQRLAWSAIVDDMGQSFPPGLTDEKAARMMAALREGRTLWGFGVTAPRLEAYFKANLEYAREARPLIEKNKGAALLRKGAHMRALTLRKHGHSLADAYVVHRAKRLYKAKLPYVLEIVRGPRRNQTRSRKEG